MLFPSMADISLATAEASFAFPEIRRSVLFLSYLSFMNLLKYPNPLIFLGELCLVLSLSQLNVASLSRFLVALCSRVMSLPRILRSILDLSILSATKAL